MKDLAPNIFRQRLIIEGLYKIEITPLKLEEFMRTLSELLEMTIIYEPIVKNLAENINPIHKGFECVMIWAESGVSLYTWELEKFFTIDIYSCKKYDIDTVANFAKDHFYATEVVFKSI